MTQLDKLDQAAVDVIARHAIQEVEPQEISSPAIQRLIEDIRQETNGAAASQMYNRVHNRHNRGR